MDSITKLFKSLDQLEPNAELRQSILLRVNEYQKTRLFRLRMAYYATMSASLLAVIPVTQTVIFAFNQSNIYQFMSLIFTDADVVIAQWQSFAFSIVESFPIIEMTALLSLVLLMIWTVSSINKVQFQNRLLQIKTI